MGGKAKLLVFIIIITFLWTWVFLWRKEKNRS